MMSKARNACEFTLGFAVIRAVPGMLAFKGLLLCGLVHRNAKMTEEIRRIFEVVLAFADNVMNFMKRGGIEVHLGHFADNT